MKLHHIIIIPVLMLTSGCVYFDYGVHKEDPQLLPTPGVSGHEFKGYQFWSIVSNDPNIDIRHATFSYHDRSVIKSVIRVGDSKSENITIESVVLEHRDKNNNLIKPTKVKWSKLPAPSGHYGTSFQNTYEKSDFPKEVIEIIRVEFKRGVETEVLEYRFILKKKMSGTFWDVMMGV